MLGNDVVFSSFSVDDIEKAQEFYSKTLGLTVTQSDDMPMPLLHIQLVGGGKIMVYPKPDHTPATFTILNFSVNDIEKTVDELTNSGVSFESYNNEYIKTDDKGIAHDETGSTPSIAWFKDPAGNIIAVMQEK
ncbi:MAG TPA: VOC family protein [Candidatus Saccharimonadales bacterium]|nr:VOC family protein [Candidatus Saccharimonadales bacterium]